MNKQNFSFFNYLKAKTPSGGGLTLLEKKSLTKPEANNSTIAGDLKPPTSNTFLTGQARVIIISLFATLACVGIIKAATTIGTNISTGGTITGSGANTLYGATSIGGALTATSSLAVNGASTLYGALTVYGDSTVSNLTATGTLAVLGNTTLSGILTGYGNTTLSNLTATGTLSVTGLTTLGNASTTMLSVSSNAYLATTTIAANGTGAFRINKADGSSVINIDTSSGPGATEPARLTINSINSGWENMIELNKYGTGVVPNGLVWKKAQGTASAPTALQQFNEIGGYYIKAYDGTNYDITFRFIGKVQDVQGGAEMGMVTMATNDETGNLFAALTLDAYQNVYMGSTIDDDVTTPPAAGARGSLVLSTRTAPTSNQTDGVQLYSADISGAGDAGLSIRTENGSIFSVGKKGLENKLYDNSSTPQVAATSTKTFTYSRIVTDTTTDGGCSSVTTCIDLPQPTTFGILEVSAYEASGPTKLWGKFMVLSDGTVNLLKDSSGADELTNNTGKTIDDIGGPCDGSSNTHLCVFDQGAKVRILNDTGNTLTVMVNLIYD
jgi:hypothetical protein